MSDSTGPGPIRRFFSSIWGAITWLRRTLANVLFVLIVLIIVVAIAKREPDILPQTFALHLAPSGQLVDQRSPIDPLSALNGHDARNAETLVSDVVRAIDRAAEDDRVEHLLLDLNHLHSGGIGKLYEIGQALERFSQSGKPITAVGDHYRQHQYYLASHADTVYLHDMGHVLLTGFGNYRTYFKEATDKLGVNFHVFRAGQFKDAVEPFTRNDMSEASREHNSQWLNRLWDAYTSRVESMRSLPVGAINDLIARSEQALRAAGGDSAKMALEASLVDKVASRQQIRAELIEQFGYDKERDSFKAVNWHRYLDHQKELSLPGKPYVGVITASGAIIEGEQPPGTTGSETLIQLLRRAREDRDVKALVIRIDSPGGSAFASEVIRAEIVATRDAGIPVVVSMGAVAASGGYWIASAADEIWALPTTITGSIGVFSVIPTLEESLKKLGIHTDGVGTTELAGAMNPARPLGEDSAAIIQMTVDSHYQRFVNLVSQARGLSPEKVDQVGQGRVWSGARAQELGLVDKLGTRGDAIAAAAGFAELSNWEVKTIAPKLTPSERFFQQLAGVEIPLPQALAQWQTLLQALPRTPYTGLKARHMYARCIGCELANPGQ